MGKGAWAALLVAAAVAWGWTQHRQDASQPPVAPAESRSTPAASTGLPAYLPPEALDTLALVRAGGPFPYRQDGSVFQNRERRLPPQPRGYYREYTVETPGSPDRGARRIVAGGQPPADFFFSFDHYRCFRRFEWDAWR
jgi:guanyl-specific ribonuclease Sa